MFEEYSLNTWEKNPVIYANITALKYMSGAS